MWFRITRNMGYLSANCGITECQCSSKCGLTANFLQRPIMPSLYNTNNPALGLSSFQGSQKGLRCFPMRCWDTVRFHLLVFSAILKPKANEESQGDLLWQMKMNQCVQHEQSCPISLSLTTLDLIEMVASGLLVAARNLCVCEHKHSAFKKENGNKELLNQNQIPVKTWKSPCASDCPTTSLFKVVFVSLFSPLMYLICMASGCFLPLDLYHCKKMQRWD